MGAQLCSRPAPILRICLSRTASHGGAENDGVCSTPAASGTKVGGRGDRGDTWRGTWGWHAAAPAAGCQVAMVTSRRDAAPINSQFEVILLKELFFPWIFLYTKSQQFFMFTCAYFIVSLYYFSLFCHLFLFCCCCYFFFLIFSFHPRPGLHEHSGQRFAISLVLNKPKLIASSVVACMEVG